MDRSITPETHSPGLSLSMKTTMAWSRSWQICVRCRRLAVHSSGLGSSARTKRGRAGFLKGAGVRSEGREVTWCGPIDRSIHEACP